MSFRDLQAKGRNDEGTEQRRLRSTKSLQTTARGYPSTQPLLRPLRAKELPESAVRTSKLGNKRPQTYETKATNRRPVRAKQLPEIADLQARKQTTIVLVDQGHKLQTRPGKTAPRVSSTDL